MPYIIYYCYHYYNCYYYYYYYYYYYFPRQGLLILNVRRLAVSLEDTGRLPSLRLTLAATG